MNKKLVFLILLGAIISPVSALATGAGCVTSGLTICCGVEVLGVPVSTSCCWVENGAPSAGCCSTVLGGTCTPPGIPPTVPAQTTVTIQSMMDAAVQTTFYIADGIIVILWVIAGILFLAAQGAPDKLSSAKKALLAAAIGTVVVIVAASAISIVGSAFGLQSLIP